MSNKDQETCVTCGMNRKKHEYGNCDHSFAATIEQKEFQDLREFNRSPKDRKK